MWLEDRPWAHHSSFPLPCGKQTPHATDNALGLPECNKILLETPKPSEVGSSLLEVQIKTVVILMRPKKCKDVEGRQPSPRWEAFPTSYELWLHLEAARTCCCRQGSGGVRFLKELRLTQPAGHKIWQQMTGRVTCHESVTPLASRSLGKDSNCYFPMRPQGKGIPNLGRESLPSTAPHLLLCSPDFTSVFAFHWYIVLFWFGLV